MADTLSKPEAAALRDANREWRADQKRLAKAPANDSMTPHIARLEPFQIMEIERMAAQGMNLDQIGTRLRFPLDVWSYMIEINPEIADAYRSGAVRGIDLVSQAAFRVAQAGDPGMSRFWLERLGGPQFNRKPDGPAVIVQTGPIVHIDQDAMDRRFERQRALIDGTADELKDHE
jgi:hypothetical protein